MVASLISNAFGRTRRSLAPGPTGDGVADRSSAPARRHPEPGGRHGPECFGEPGSVQAPERGEGGAIDGQHAASVAPSGPPRGGPATHRVSTIEAQRGFRRSVGQFTKVICPLGAFAHLFANANSRDSAALTSFGAGLSFAIMKAALISSIDI